MNVAGAMLMAMYINGLSKMETANLTRTMVLSGSLIVNHYQKYIYPVECRGCAESTFSKPPHVKN